MEPDRRRVVAELEAGRPQLLWTSLVADLETPVSAFLKLGEREPYRFLLESVPREAMRTTRGPVRDRYSIIGLRPDLVWRCRGGRAEINRRVLRNLDAFEPVPGHPLDSLRTLVAGVRVARPPGLPPMAAGLFGYLGYDMVRLVERLPDRKPDVLGIPDAVFVRPTVVVVFDNQLGIATLVTPVWPEETAAAGLDARRAVARAAERLEEAREAFTRSLVHDPSEEPERPLVPTANVTPERFHEMVRRAKEYIFAGDIFQVVLSQRFEAPFDLPAFALYRELRKLNPSPYLFHLEFDGFALVGSSPEILVKLDGDRVTVRPIAGTRRRGGTLAEDERLARELLDDPKELAEHLMLLDLGRNDVGRVAEIGSVRVSEKMVVEYYSHVMHIVSTVEGRLRAGLSPVDALLAGFPAGTVSGAPKIRAMEIIEELEPERRGFYAGAVGYFGADGSMDTCIAIRTALVRNGRLYVQAGAGIVADSVPEREFEETVNKARALIRAAEGAPKYAGRRRRAAG